MNRGGWWAVAHFFLNLGGLDPGLDPGFYQEHHHHHLHALYEAPAGVWLHKKGARTDRRLHMLRNSVESAVISEVAGKMSRLPGR